MSNATAEQIAGISVHLTYERPADAADWLCRVFGMREVGRASRTDTTAPFMLAGPCGGTVMVWGLTDDFTDWMRSRAPGFHQPAERPWPYLSHSVSVHVLDVDEHHERSQRESAPILSSPKDQPWGIRSYAALDPEGHQWEFVQIPASAEEAVG